MKLRELKINLGASAEANIRFRLPDGGIVPAHAHVTEVARIDKRFIDCGGKFRENAFCRLQTWVAEDIDHRLTAGKLLRILEMAGPVLSSDELEVDIEHELNVISQFPLESVTLAGTEMVLQLSLRHTACLAMEKCCPPAPAPVAFDPIKFMVNR